MATSVIDDYWKFFTLSF